VADVCRYAERREAKYEAMVIGLSFLFVFPAGPGLLFHPRSEPAESRTGTRRLSEDGEFSGHDPSDP